MSHYRTSPIVQTLESVKSVHLTNEENELVFTLVGSRNQSQCTAIAQLFQAGPPTYRHWMKRHTGVLCFVKDNAKRSYYFRLYCLLKHEMVWQHEIYEEIEISRVKPFLLTFEGHVRFSMIIDCQFVDLKPLFTQNTMIAFNFAFIDEAENFLYISTSTIERRNRRRNGDFFFISFLSHSIVDSFVCHLRANHQFSFERHKRAISTILDSR